MVLLNWGYLHCMDIREILVNSSLKATKRKITYGHLKIQVSDIGPSWASCSYGAPAVKTGPNPGVTS